MMSPIGRRRFLQSSVALGALSSINATAGAAALPYNPPSGANDREYWIRVLDRISAPVLKSLSQKRLKAEMPVEAPHGNVEDRGQFTYLEAMGRLLAGIARWLESGPDNGAEGKLRNQYADWSRLAIQSATDPTSPDFMNFNKGLQPLVDSAFLALAIVRAPTQLWHKLDSKTQQDVRTALESSRVIKPPYSNWLLFSAMVETALSLMGAWWDAMRVDYAIRSVESWYKGDGVYGDGPPFHWDYYNSFVVQPMLLNILDTISKSSNAWDSCRQNAVIRAQRYAVIQERLIAPDGTFAPIGRSLCYRFGAFQLLAEIALRRQLPEEIGVAQVRCALTSVMRRMIDAPGTFDEEGWLRIGFCGHQPELAEAYISTGSCYLCSAALLPLGLPAADPFWSGPATPWTSSKAWSGSPVEPDHAIAD